MIVISRTDDWDKIEELIDKDNNNDAILRNKTMFEDLIWKQANSNLELDVLQFIEWR
jgi:hypothetical protein